MELLEQKTPAYERGRSVYGPNDHEFERKGRTMSALRAGSVVGLLLVLGGLPWVVAFGALPSNGTAQQNSVALASLFDIMLNAAYATLATRLYELVRLHFGQIAMIRRWRKAPGTVQAALAAAVVAIAAAVVNVGLGLLLLASTLEGQDHYNQLRSWTPVSDGLVAILLSLLVVLVLRSPADSKKAAERAAAGVRPETIRVGDDEPPVQEEGLMTPTEGDVICCSGGGIRSASFSLGALQVLNDAGVYADARAVLGVSGGGYIASAMHVVRARSDEVLAPQPFDPGSPEVAWLGRNSRYLFASLQVATSAGLTLAFGIGVNVFLLGVALLLAASWLGWFYATSGGISAWNDDQAVALQFVGNWGFLHWTWLLFLAVGILWVGANALDRVVRVPWIRGLRESLASAVWVVLPIVLVTHGVPRLLVAVHNYTTVRDNPLARLLSLLGFSHADPASAANASGLSLGVVLISVSAVVTAVRRPLKDVGKLPGPLRRALTAVVNVVLPWTAVGVLGIVAVLVLVRRIAGVVSNGGDLGPWSAWVWIAVTMLLLRLLTDANRTSLHTFYRERLSRAFMLERLPDNKVQQVPYVEPLRFSQLRSGRPELMSCAVANVSDGDLVPTDRNCVPFVFTHDWIGISDETFPSKSRAPSILFERAADRRCRLVTVPAAMAISGAAISPLAGRFTRSFAPYRAVLALANARLGVWVPNPLWMDVRSQERRLVRLRQKDDLRAALMLKPDDKRSAYLDELSEEVSKRNRRWLLSIKHDLGVTAGTPGDAPDRTSTGVDPAAANRASIWEVAQDVIAAVRDQPFAFRLMKEAFGRTSVYDRFLYVTDGGHFDNLGLVEALRLKPKRVFVIDASSDTEDSFTVLASAIATARIDLGCEIAIDIDPMRRGTSTARRAWASGTATYPDKQQTTVHFVKAIVTKQLPPDLVSYAATNPAFPRTSTGQQLYGEFDLEAYRTLGRAGTLALVESLRRKGELVPVAESDVT